MTTMLSLNFALREFLRSEQALRLGLTIEPSPDDIANLRRLCANVLEPVRRHFGRPVYVTSGLRPPWLNKIIGGSPTSAHMWGGAADIEVSGVSNYEVCLAVDQLHLPQLDQCILEFGNAGWVHLGIARLGTTPRQQFLTAYSERGVTHYRPGLHLNL